MLLRVLALLCCFAGLARADERVDLPTRPGVTQGFVFMKAEAAKRQAVMFVGGDGVFAEVGRNNFMTRVAPRLVAQGISVALADAPSDHPRGMDDGFRASAEHAQDIAAVIGWMQARAKVPVWLIGTSRGTVSAAAVAARLGPPRVAGLVLTSTVWANLRAVTALEQVAVPTLVIHNRDDGCRESPYAAAADGVAALRRAPVKEFVSVSGGISRSAPCQALSQHGYFGIEAAAADPMIAWVLSH